MLITKFNRMIKSRVIWGVIAVVVSIAFVAGYSNSDGCSQAERRRGMAGSLNGRNVPLRTFYDMRRYTVDIQNRKLSDEDLEGLDARTWRRLAALETARELGLSPSDEEVGRVIRQEFAPEGPFDRTVYERWLEDRGLPRAFFEEWMRQEVALQKLTTILSAAVWVAPADLEPEIAQRTDDYTVEFAEFGTNVLHIESEVSLEQAREFFDENRELFMIPEKVSVRYVSFPVSNYLAAIQIEDDAVASYYTNHVDEFTEPAFEGDASDTNRQERTLPFEAVREAIRETLTWEKALKDARYDATTFVVSLAPDRAGRAPSFDAAAAAATLSVGTSGFFSAYEQVPDLAVGIEFNKAAFALEPSSADRYFSDAIPGETAVFVMAAHEKQDPRIPEFEEVTNRVMTIALFKARRDALQEKREALRSGVVEAMSGGATFTDAAKGLGANAVTSTTFSVSSLYFLDRDEILYYDALSSVVPLKAGEVSDPVSLQDSVVVAHVVKREPGSPAAREAARSQLTASYNQFLSRVVFESWQEQNLVDCRFEDFLSQPEPEADRTPPSSAVAPDVVPE